MNGEAAGGTQFKGLAGWIASVPIAHRGLHDKANGIYENTLSAARRAAERGFGIEVDLHPAADGTVMVFHDDTLERLTAEKGDMRARTASELGRISIGGSADRVPTLRQLLELVDGRVPLVLELKGRKDGDAGFVEAVAAELATYRGQVGVMSFDHWLVEDARRLMPDLAVGLTAEGDDSLFAVHEALAGRAGIDFVSYGISDLPCRFVEEFRKSGRPVITWTIRSPADARKSAMFADQITFEGFDPRDGG
ncbi:MAG: glycerophosphodiester phosphodiesterase family protein [Rhizobiaceae bacterium]